VFISIPENLGENMSYSSFPYYPLSTSNEVNKLVDNIMKTYKIDNKQTQYVSHFTDTSAVYKISAPGYAKSDLSIDFVDDALHITSTTENDFGSKLDVKILVKHKKNFDFEKMSAVYLDGVLKLTVPLLKEQKNTFKVQII
jgi:HSP20 family molecular chaperone IbpA